MRSQRNLKLSSILLCHLFLLRLIPTFVQGSCTSNDQCGNPREPLCISGTCKGCQQDTDCTTYMPGTIKCYNSFGTCLSACTANTDCTNSIYPKCGSTGSCTTCGGDTDCTSNPFFGTGFKCTSFGLPCGASCTADTDCTDPAASYCEASEGNHCLTCSSDSQCTHLTATPYCLDFVTCVECESNSQCASGTCNNYKCVCNSNSDCTQSTLSRCYHDVCQSCAADSDCTHISGKPSCVSGTCQVAVVSASASSSGDITDGDIIIGAVFGSIAGVVVVAIVVYKILSWQKQRKALQSNPHQKVKATSINAQSPSDLSTPVHSESAPFNQKIDVKPSI